MDGRIGSSEHIWYAHHASPTLDLPDDCGAQSSSMRTQLGAHAVFTSHPLACGADVPISSCFASNGTSAEEAIAAETTFVAPTELSSSRVVCVAPTRDAPIVTDLDIALNGQDYHSNGLTYSYYIQVGRPP